MWYEPGEEPFVRYLLGELSAPERDQFENEYFADDAVHEQLLAMECELIDAYVRDDLSSGERRDFERRYLTTSEGRERVERARLVCAYSAPVPRLSLPRFESLPPDPGPSELPMAALVPGRTPETNRVPDSVRSGEKARRIIPWWDGLIGFFRFQPAAVRLVFVPAALILVFVPLALMLRSRHATETASVREQPPTLPSQVPHPPTMPSQLQDVAPTSNTSSGPQGTGLLRKELRTNRIQAEHLLETPLAFILTPTVRGEGDGNTLRLPSGAHRIKLQIVLQGDAYSTYRADLQTPEGRQIFTKDHLRAVADPKAGRVVEIMLSSSMLTQGDYTLRLIGVDEDGHAEVAGGYSFRCASTRAPTAHKPE